MSDMEFYDTGIKQEITRDLQKKLEDKLTVKYEYAIKSKTHLWIATVMYLLSNESVKNMTSPNSELNLDMENLLGSPGVGCYICEQPYGPYLLNRKCTGEPK